MRLTRRRLLDMYPEDYARIRAQVELDLYPQVIEDWNRLNAPLMEDLDG